jgi:hypothetical protein
LLDLSEMPPEDWSRGPRRAPSVRVVSFEPLPGEVESFAIPKDSRPARKRRILSRDDFGYFLASARATKARRDKADAEARIRLFAGGSGAH